MSRCGDPVEGRMILKTKLNSAARPVLDTFLGLPTPAPVEATGRSGFDFIILDGEHGCFSADWDSHK